ncbi:hypothetical protein RMSM_02208 [Rhodopirellula maiorica SM1]|uniref:Uncharacterized protein n=1 Tax=Rhodopirellula maiorica SM1 TaxID=1265738 RepID=M5S3U0_9BACT|nr:hypothetical protein RMSM_02208 [Rhodopirellula maiorica SM1]
MGLGVGPIEQSFRITGGPASFVNLMSGALCVGRRRKLMPQATDALQPNRGVSRHVPSAKCLEVVSATTTERVTKASGHCREFVLGYDVDRSVRN